MRGGEKVGCGGQQRRNESRGKIACKKGRVAPLNACSAYLIIWVGAASGPELALFLQTALCAHSIN